MDDDISAIIAEVESTQIRKAENNKSAFILEGMDASYIKENIVKIVILGAILTGAIIFLIKLILTFIGLF